MELGAACGFGGGDACLADTRPNLAACLLLSDAYLHGFNGLGVDRVCATTCTVLRPGFCVTRTGLHSVCAFETFFDSIAFLQKLIKINFWENGSEHDELILNSLTGAVRLRHTSFCVMKRCLTSRSFLGLVGSLPKEFPNDIKLHYT
jgi:hypothetical protein